MTVFGTAWDVLLFSNKTINLTIINLTMKKMKKKDLLLECFDARLQKVELNLIHGGYPGITQTTQLTPKYGGGTETDPKTDQE